MKLTGLDFIKDYREHPENFLPFLDHLRETPSKNEYGEVNIGWNAGLLEENRPYFAICWAVDQMTILTIYVSSIGMEDITPKEMYEKFEACGYYKCREGITELPEIRAFHDSDGNGFFSVNIVVGIDGEPSRIEGASVIPWKLLNDYNRESSDKVRM